MGTLKYSATLLFSLIFIWNQEVNAQVVTGREALVVAENYSQARIHELTTASAEPLIHQSDTLAWVIRCRPAGFIVISASRDLSPVLAWSAEGNFGEGEAWRTFLPILKNDIAGRKRFIIPGSAESVHNRQLWETWQNTGSSLSDFRQWPPEGYSLTGGWLFTNWTQTAPYNDFCPVDGQTQTRSVAGCPATAMAQVVNYHKELHQTRFSDDDDYFHNYGSGNQYWIDNDWSAFGFPSFNQLNVYLDTLDAHLTNGTTLKNDDKAALTFACGVAARQVYSSSGSGTYGINQAYDAYIRFGYTDTQLVYPADTSLNTHVAENIKIGLPAHLGIVNPDWTAGHNVVVDGYNTDELYHFNFGWGGSANGWYTLPPTSIPYNLTVIEGVVLDINLSHPPVGIVEQATVKPFMYFDIFSEELIVIIPDNSTGLELTVYDIYGRKSLCESLYGRSYRTVLQMSSLSPGLYIGVLGSPATGNVICKFLR